MIYESGCIKNMEYVGSYKNCIRSKKLLLPFCCRQYLIESMKKLMKVMKYEGGFFENM